MRHVDAVDAWGHVALASADLKCGMRSAAKYIHSRSGREVEALMVQLAARARRTCKERSVEYPIYFEQATIFCPRFIISSTLRATRAP